MIEDCWDGWLKTWREGQISAWRLRGWKDYMVEWI